MIFIMEQLFSSPFQKLSLKEGPPVVNVLVMKGLYAQAGSPFTVFELIVYKERFGRIQPVIIEYRLPAGRVGFAHAHFLREVELLEQACKVIARSYIVTNARDIPAQGV